MQLIFVIRLNYNLKKQNKMNDQDAIQELLRVARDIMANKKIADEMEEIMGVWRKAIDDIRRKQRELIRDAEKSGGDIDEINNIIKAHNGWESRMVSAGEELEKQKKSCKRL